MADGENLSAEQNEKLAYFQEITHIESLDECKQILEAFEWNMEGAVQNTFNDPIGTPTPSVAASTHSHSSSAASLAGLDDTSAHASSSTSTSAFAMANGALLNNNNNNNVLHHANTNHDHLIFSSPQPQPQSSMLNRHTRPSMPPLTPPSPPPPMHTGATVAHYRSPSQQQLLPSVNVIQPRTLSYPGLGDINRAPPPHGIFQWSLFLVSFPFKLIISSLYDLVSFFMALFFDRTPAIPIDYDPLANIAEFTIDYNQKFGTNHPEFYAGSYTQAVNEAKRELKFLLVYVHEKENADSTRLASETMCNAELIDYLTRRAQFVVWACSRDLPEGCKVFGALKARRCPFLGVICLRHGRMSLVMRIEGPIGPNELARQLASCVLDNEAELVAARADREQRNQTQLIRQQQDAAYEESLRLDREKARRKMELEEAVRRERDAERMRIEEEQARIQRIMDRKSELRRILSETKQPEASDASAIKLIIKLPNGNRFERVFLKSDPLSQLYKFVFSNEECPLNFEIVTNFPRKVVECDEDTSQSIQEFGINQSMILFVNDLDA